MASFLNYRHFIPIDKKLSLKRNTNNPYHNRHHPKPKPGDSKPAKPLGETLPTQTSADNRDNAPSYRPSDWAGQKSDNFIEVVH